MLYDKKWDRQVEPEIKLEPWRVCLNDAAKILEERGWCQGISQNAIGNVCAMRAIGIAVDGLTTSGWVSNEAVRHLSMFIYPNCPPSRLPAIPAWNDAAGRTEEEVITTLREAAQQE